LFNKPHGVLTQFTSDEDRRTLADFIDVPGVYPAGRLDADSEGLVVLTDDGVMQARISEPKHKMTKVYWVQVEGVPSAAALESLRSGVNLGDFISGRCEADLMAEPVTLWSRDPPIRYRAAVPTSWIRLAITEGKNRQVRRMTAKVGFPTLRLVRWSVGPWTLDGLELAQWRRLAVSEVAPVAKSWSASVPALRSNRRY
jgi:23S rRNA pseudouridine2457 synthase